MSSWRDNARPIIARVLRETAGQPETEIRQALFSAYPWGPRQHHPYKIWLDEIQRQRGRKKPLGRMFGAPRQATPPDPRQQELFA